MDVLFLGAGRPSRGQAPSALKPMALKTRALDWQLDSLGVLETEPRIQFIGGYGVDQVARLYADLNYVVVPDWAEHGILHSLMRAHFGEDSALIAYSDTVFRKRALTALLSTGEDVAFGYDSKWRERYPMRAAADMARAETLEVEGAVVEFTGLLHLTPAAAAHLRAADERAIGANLIDVIDYLRGAGFVPEPVDLAGLWAEFDDPGDVARFVLGTKAETLARLASRVRKSRIGAQTSFTTEDWRADPDGLLDRIAAEHAAEWLIVRSSSAAEDGWGASQAGRFESVADIAGGDRAALGRAIDRVVASYGDDAAGHHVLVQAQIRDVRCAGVVLSCGLDTGSPYYRINLDSSGSTSGVTSGVGEMRTLLVSRDRPERLETLDRDLVPVLDAVREVEEILAFERLDIEFGQERSGTVHLFQVRPITVDHSAFEFEAEALRRQSASNIAQFDRLQAPAAGLAGSRTVFGVMPDWNPAEIIGTRPRPLALSLYRKLVTDAVWAEQRADFGYRDVRPHRLLASFSGQPYVDARASFNSFVPASVGDAAAARIVDAYLTLLAEQPDLHDKVEFDVAFTVWDPGLRAAAEERLGRFGVESGDLDALDAGLKTITQAALLRLDADIAPIVVLDARREAIERSAMAAIDRGIALIEDCALFGTPAFAHAARAGFVASTLLRRMVALGVLEAARADAFMRSLDTVARELHNAAALPREGRIARFGHLRPGTYDITRKAYREDPDLYFSAADDGGSPPDLFVPTGGERVEIAAFLAELGSPLDPEEFATYLRRALEARESVKFAFTRNLSLALDSFVEAGAAIGMTRDDLSYLDYGDLVDWSRGGTTPDALMAASVRGSKRHRQTQVTELPPLIVSAEDFHGFEQARSTPNFVTLGRAQGRVQRLATDADRAAPGEIVLIESADPGYDWLLGRGIAGFVTKYGGANSHMAIRAAEIGLPAVIGTGEQLFEQVAAMRLIELDCAGRAIRKIA